MELLLVPLLLSVGLTLLLRWSIRRAQERQARQMQDEMDQRAAAGESPPPPVGPFGLLPFGGLFEQMLSQGAWTRSYVYDPDTGEWVEVVETPDAVETPGRPDRSGEAHRPSGGATPPEPPTTTGRRPAERSRRRSASQGLFGDMLGGLGGLNDGSGDFVVRSPDELPTFEEVGAWRR
jgi:hypothetical protein